MPKLAQMSMPLSIFHRYLRQPGIEDSRFGLGLGIRMVHSAAQKHGGTLLISRVPRTGFHIGIYSNLPKTDSLKTDVFLSFCRLIRKQL